MEVPSTILPLRLQAAEAWIRLGCTSATNPLHALLLAELFNPLGLSCEFMECEPLTNRGTLMRPEFRQPRWSLHNVSPTNRQIFPAAEVLASYQVTPRTSGLLTFTRKDGAEPALLPEFERFNDGSPVNDHIENCRETAARVIVLAFHLACSDHAEDDFSLLLAGSPETFASKVWEKVRDRQT